MHVDRPLRNRPFRPATFVACLAALIVGAATPGARAVTDDDIGKSIDKIRKYFYDNQGADGSWEHLYEYKAGHEIPNKGGITALITLALMYAGDSPQSPALSKAIAWLEKEQLSGCYSRSFRAHIYAHMPDSYLKALSADVNWLINISNKDLSFPHPSVGELPQIDEKTGVHRGELHHDNSITQYGHLAIWEALKRDVPLSRDVFRQMADYWLGGQGTDGGWGYSDAADRKEDGYASMTAAGVTCLIIAEQGLYRHESRRNPQMAKAIERGLAWLDERFDGIRCMGNSKDRRGFDWYYIVCLERAALAGGITTLNGKDWFNACAAEVVREVLTSNTGRVPGAMQAADTAFALMFLSRGRVPVWCGKVKLKDRAWNNRPNDLYFLNHFLSTYLETPINWQTIELDRPVRELRVTPVLYLSSDEAVVLNETEKANLKAYLEQGGLLMANAEGRSAAFARSIEALAAELFPAWEMKALEAGHPMLDAAEPVAAGGYRGNIKTLHNGVRDLIVLSRMDLGYMWQSQSSGGRDDPWRFAVNLFVTACNRGVLENRLVAQRVRYDHREAAETMTVGRLSRGESVDPEPGFWPLVSRMINDRAKFGVTVQLIAFGDLADTDAPLVHLSGTEVTEFTAQELDALMRYVDAGGWALVTNPGGHGRFADAFIRSVQTHSGRRVGVMLDTDPMLSGEGLQYAYAPAELTYNRYSVARFGTDGQRPRVRVIRSEREGGGALVVLPDDVELALLNAHRWGVIGHNRESSERLMTNLLLRVRAAQR